MILNATCVVIGVAHDLSEYRYMVTSREACFLCFAQHGARFWKCLWDFGLKQVKCSKNVRQELFTRQKNGETRTKRALDYLRMPKLQEIFTTAADRVSSLDYRYVRLPVVQIFFALILLWAIKDVEKLFEETEYNQVKGKKKKQRQKVALGT